MADEEALRGDESAGRQGGVVRAEPEKTGPCEETRGGGVVEVALEDASPQHAVVLVGEGDSNGEWSPAEQAESPGDLKQQCSGSVCTEEDFASLPDCSPARSRSSSSGSCAVPVSRGAVEQPVVSQDGMVLGLQWCKEAMASCREAAAVSREGLVAGYSELSTGSPSKSSSSSAVPGFGGACQEEQSRRSARSTAGAIAGEEEATGCKGSGGDTAPEAAFENELTREVPMLLESMNRASSDVNAFERQASEAQERYRHLMEQWSRLHEDQRMVYGQAFETARPYFEAIQALQMASHLAHDIAREFSAAASQHAQAKAELRSIEERVDLGGSQVRLDAEQQEEISRVTMKVFRTRQFRDKCEQEYARVVRDYQEAKDAEVRWHTEIGDAMIRRTLPCFRLLQQHQVELTKARNRIGALVERARASKLTYHSSLRELDRINIAVHSARQPSDKSATKTDAEEVPMERETRDSLTLPDPSGPRWRTSSGNEASEAFAFGTPEVPLLPLSRQVSPLPSKGCQEHSGMIDDGPFA